MRNNEFPESENFNYSHYPSNLIGNTSAEGDVLCVLRDTRYPGIGLEMWTYWYQKERTA